MVVPRILWPWKNCIKSLNFIFSSVGIWNSIYLWTSLSKLMVVIMVIQKLTQNTYCGRHYCLIFIVGFLLYFPNFPWKLSTFCVRRNWALLWHQVCWHFPVCSCEHSMQRETLYRTDMVQAGLCSCLHKLHASADAFVFSCGIKRDKTKKCPFLPHGRKENKFQWAQTSSKAV